MIRLGMSVDMGGTEKLLKSLPDKVVSQAGSMSINKVAAKGRTEMVRAITSEYAIKAGDVRAKLRLLKATRKPGGLAALLDPFASGSKRSLNAVHFLENKVTLAEDRRRRKAGTQNQIRFKIKKKGGPKTIRGAFLGNKGRTVFKRTSDARYPIEPVQTVGVPQMFGTSRILIRVVGRIRREYPIEYKRAVEQVLRRFNK